MNIKEKFESKETAERDRNVMKEIIFAAEIP